jgi:hypothetical protein
MKVLDFLGAIVKGPVTVAADVYKRRLEIKRYHPSDESVFPYRRTD